MITRFGLYCVPFTCPADQTEATTSYYSKLNLKTTQRVHIIIITQLTTLTVTFWLLFGIFVNDCT